MNRPGSYNGDFTFTLFVVLPSDEVCSLRQLPSGVTVHEVKGRLELSAGLPSHVYYLVYPDGDRLEDYQRLMVQENVKDGYILRVKVLENWEALFNAVSKNNIQNVLMNGGVQIKGSGVVSSDCAVKVEEQLQDRGETALYIASYNGFFAMCGNILSIGVNSNGCTSFGRTPLHAAVCRDQLKTLDLLLRHGGSMQQADVFGCTVFEVARLFQSKLCMKKLRVMQLNLRGIDNPAHNVNRKLRIRKQFLNPTSLSKLVPDERSISSGRAGRPKTATSSRSHASGNRSPQSQCSIETKDTGTTSCYTLESMTSVSKQFDAASASSRGSSLRITVADNSRLGTGRTISSSSSAHRPCKALTGVINMKPLPSDHLYWRFVEINHKESADRTKLYSHPLEILRSRRTNVTRISHGAGVHIESVDGSQISEGGEMGQNLVTANNDERETKGDTDRLGDDGRGNQSSTAGILKGYRSFSDHSKTPIRPKTVRFLKRPQTTNAIEKPNEPETRKSMQRKINIATTQARQDTKRRLREFVNKDYSPPPKDNENDSGNDSEDSENREKANEAFQKWIQEKEEEKYTHIRPKMPVRPLTGIITTGSTVVGDGSPPSPTNDMYAHRDWLEKKRKQKVQNGERMKAASEFMAEKKRLEEKRQQLLLTAISYEEWMENNEERKSLIRDILQADMAHLKKIERDYITRRAPSQISFGEWQDLLKTREKEVRMQKHNEQRLKEDVVKLKLERSSNAKTHAEWVKNKKEEPMKEKFIPNSDLEKNKEELRQENEKQYNIWLDRKHREEMAKLQNVRPNEKPVPRGERKQRVAHLVVPC
ncbi:hypothetical protein ScPMuIL_000358 [Solemya velum]